MSNFNAFLQNSNDRNEEVVSDTKIFEIFSFLTPRFKNEIKRSMLDMYEPPFEEWKDLSENQKDYFLNNIISAKFISKMPNDIKKKIIENLEHLPQVYGGEVIHGVPESKNNVIGEDKRNTIRSINNTAYLIREYLAKNYEDESIKSLLMKAKEFKGVDAIRNEWQIFLLGLLNFWDFNDFKNFEKEIVEFRKRNKIDVNKFKEEREKIQQIFVEHLSDEYAKKINEELERSKNAVDLLDRYIKGEIDESRLMPIINLDYWRRYMIENILELDRNNTNLIKQKENEITEIFKKEVKEKIKPYYEDRVKVLSKKEFVRDEIIRNLYSNGYQQIKYCRIEDLIHITQKKLEVYTDANFIFFDKNDSEIKYGIGATSTHPIENLFMLVLIKKENKLYSFEKLKEKIESHPKLKRIPEYFQCLLKDYIFYGDFNKKDWDLIRAYRSENANKDLGSIRNIFQDENGQNFDDYTTPNRFLRKATAFYIKEGILIEKVKTALENRNISPFLRHILEEKLGEDIEKLNEYLRRQKSKKTKSYWNLINSIMEKLGYAHINGYEYRDFVKSVKFF
jgi:hypothetical protein